MEDGHVLRSIKRPVIVLDNVPQEPERVGASTQTEGDATEVGIASISGGHHEEEQLDDPDQLLA